MHREYQMLVGGHWLPSQEHIEVCNKYTGEVLGLVPMVDKELFEMAVIAAQEGFTTMSQMPSYQRSKILSECSKGIEKEKDEFIRIILEEAGKPRKYAQAEVERAIQTFQFAAEEAKNIKGETVPLDTVVGAEKRVGFYMRFPVGIVGAISPFNFPLNLVAHKVAPAIAAGCSVVLKPSSLTPLTAIKLGEVLTESGLPTGALNIVFGSGNTVGEWIVTDPRIALISFTGSAPVGKRIKQISGLKKLILELGSNSAVVIDETADLELSVQRCIYGGFAYSGQVCISVQRIFVNEKIYSAFIQKMLEGIEKLKIGNPSEPDIDIGPMISESEAKRVEEWVNEAVSSGAKTLTGGKREGNFYHPTVLTNVHPDMKVMSYEAFAPLVCIIPFFDFSQALKMVNESVYGLQAGVFTQKLEAAFEAVRSLQVGGVIINDAPTFRADNMPYGGVKESGIGREGVKFAIEEMTDIKMVCFNLP